ncbi:MAG: hypothetical protein E7463_14005 [Ruminococcaceae bacterium]|nr:hypothetical protein [Oscillospiraceae bacterium]
MEFANPAPKFGVYDPNSILTLNRDMEPCVIQSSSPRNDHFKDPYVPLQFVHFSDVHNQLPLWNRLVEYVNHYRDYISFALHTGDYCGNYQGAYTDCYNEGVPCVHPVLNCTGNHDTNAHNTLLREPYRQAPKEKTHSLLFNRTENWDVTFMDAPSPMAYYKDIPQSNLRLIVLDLYYDLPEQIAWLEGVLKDAREKDLCVITASHAATDFVSKPLPVTFQTKTDYTQVGGKDVPSPFEPAIVHFKEAGGKHVCHLAGHRHSDYIGYTDAGVLNVIVECATNWNGWTDGLRAENSRNYDCFNVMTVDTVMGLIKIVRIGDCMDHYLRPKHVLCYDYVNREVISNW